MKIAWLCWIGHKAGETCNTCGTYTPEKDLYYPRFFPPPPPPPPPPPRIQPDTTYIGIGPRPDLEE